MIVKMKSLWLICQAKDRQQALDALAGLECVHVNPVTAPEGSGLEHAEAAVRRIEQVLEVLPHEPAADAASGARSPETLIDEVLNAVKQAQQDQHGLEQIRAEITRIEAFGEFSPDKIHELETAGLTVKLLRYNPKTPLELPESATLVPLSESSRESVAVAISPEPFETEAEVACPKQGLSELRQHEAELLRTSEERRGFFAELAVHRNELEAYRTRLQDQLEAVRVAAGMGSQGTLSYLNGFCPEDRIPDLQKAAAAHGWGILLTDPTAEQDPPTLIRNPGWIKPIKAIFDMIGLTPGYREIDISVAFLLFFSVFFAILIGDAGYGALFLLLTAVARLKNPRAPAYPFTLLIILSICTMIWGVMTGTYFGITNLPAPLSALTVDWLTGSDSEGHLIRLCFFIGALHLSVAHAWNAARILNSTKALAQLGWIALTWTMYFTACTMILGSPFPSIATFLLIGGLSLVFLFMSTPRELKKEWPNHVMLPLNVISNFVDVVSYVRLFAVGSASLAVAAAFNEMALAKGFSGIGVALGSALILFFGHVLNILLGAMGILVHGVRLNTLEFSGHIGMQWTGIPFRPFARKATRENHT